MKQLIKGRPAFFDHYHERTKPTLGRDGGGGGVQGRCTLCPNFKNDRDIISAKSSFYCILFVRFSGRGGRGLQKEYIVYARENDEKNGRPLMSSTTVITVVILLLLLLL